MAKYILKGVHGEKMISKKGMNFIDFSNQSDLNSAIKDLFELKIEPTELGIDILILAKMAYLADIGESRNEKSEDGWTRELHLIVPVKNVIMWDKCKSIVKEMLDFLTGDIWTLEFKKRNWSPIKKHVGLFTGNYSGISLFSGGLDSLVGALDHLDKNTKNRNLFVSFAGDPSISKKQRDLFDLVNKHYKNINRLRFKSIKYTHNEVHREDTTRGRSFLFIAIAVFAGSGLKKKIDILIPENGIMSLNVPLTTLRLGALSTRTTHPFYIELWNRLLYELGLNMNLRNPYWNKTKGEMLKECKNTSLLQKILIDSLSCAHPAKGRFEKRIGQHCGYCIPCIIRRSAIYFAFSKDTTRYTYDKNFTIKGKVQLEQINGIKYAINRLKKYPSLSNKLIHLVASLGDDPKKIAEYNSLYKRGMKEIADFFIYWRI